MKKLLKYLLVFTLVFVFSFNGVKAQEQDDEEVVVISTRVESAPVVKIKGNNNTLTLTWKDIDNAYSYVIERSTNSKKGFKKIATVTDCTYTDKKLTYGTKYYYKVTAKGFENSKKSSVVSKKVQPNKVSNVVLRPTSTKVKISWDKTKNSGYYVYQSTDGKKWTKIKTISKRDTTSLTVKKLKSNKTYYFQVQAFQKVNSKIVTGSRSAVVSVKTSPAAPKVKLISEGINDFKLTINSVSGGDRYEVYFYNESTKKWELEDVVYSERFFENEFYDYYWAEKSYHTYKYKVRACSTKSCGYFTEVSGQAKLFVPEIYSLKAEKKAVTITFDYSYDADGYEIYRAKSKNGKYKKIKTLTGDNNQYKDTGLSSDTTYYYKTRSYGTIDGKKYYSSYSKIKSVKTGKDALANSAYADAKALSKEWYYSKKEMMNILVQYYGYDESVAEKAINKLKLNFKDLAYKNAQSIIAWYGVINESSLREILSYAYLFTDSEIDYAINKVNIHNTLLKYIKNDIRRNPGYSRTEVASWYSYEFATSDVLEAIDELNIDFGEQALYRIEVYITDNASSTTYIKKEDARAYLKDQGFEDDEIEYAITNCTYDWNAAISDAYDSAEFIDDENRNYLSKAQAIQAIVAYGFEESEVSDALDELDIDFSFVAYLLTYHTINDLEMNYGPAEITDMLENRLFTQEDIEFVLEAIDFDSVASLRALEEIEKVNNVSNRVLLRNILTNVGFEESSIEAVFEEFAYEPLEMPSISTWQILANASAANYLSTGTYSKSALVAKLKADLFTDEEANIAVSDSSFNYDAECVEYINTNYIGQTLTGTLDDLKAEMAAAGFTEDNINYAVEATNLASYF